MALFGDNKKKEKGSAPKSEKRIVHARAAKLPNGRVHEAVRAPWFSEKALLATEKGVYAFEVPTDATKAHIAGAIKEIYKVTPRKVRIVNLPGKRKALRTRRGMGTRARRRKAYIYLKAGESIQFA